MKVRYLIDFRDVREFLVDLLKLPCSSEMRIQVFPRTSYMTREITLGMPEGPAYQELLAATQSDGSLKKWVRDFKDSSPA